MSILCGEKAGSYHLGETPLHWCARQKDDCGVCITTLRELGADTSITDASGKTALSLDAQDAEKAKELRSAAKRLAYDLGSFTWPGWDEPGIELSAAYLAFGREAAQLNLRLAHELDKGALPISRANWLLGAHCLAAREFQEAARYFAEAHADATAGSNDEALLNQRYRALAMALLLPNDLGSRDLLLRLQEQLAQTPKEKGLTAQLQTAARVFGLSAEPALRKEG